MDKAYVLSPLKQEKQEYHIKIIFNFFCDAYIMFRMPYYQQIAFKSAQLN